MHIIYNLVLSFWIGGITIYTFIITPVIFKSFSRDMAGNIVGVLFPGYFWFNLILSVIALLLVLLAGLSFAKSGHRFSLLLIVLALIINIFVTFKLHPDVKEVKNQIHSFESEAEDSSLRKRFAKLHGISAGLNLLLLADGVVLLIISTALRK
ncbi:MAG: DUF4149 domain-containing protein [Nitrospiraceae bacterium]|nr:MAG: DUF4149 domain-containing protein [Nitrospiraceae bacterium]